MAKRKTFKCKSEKQKKAIRANYAKRSKKSNWQKGIRPGMTVVIDDLFMAEDFGDAKSERSWIILDVNDNKELALVPMSTKRKGQKNKSRSGVVSFKNFVEIFDKNGNPIKIGENVRLNNPDCSISNEDFEKVKKIVLHSSIQAPQNLKKFEEFKNRKKKR